MKGADALRVEGRRRRGRLQLRWEDCVKRDLAEVGGEGRRSRDRSSGDGSEPGSVIEEEKKSRTSIDA